MIGKKLQMYYMSHNTLHVTLRNGKFYNGTISYIGAEFCKFIDRKLGEVLLFFAEIINIEPFTEDRK